MCMFILSFNLKKCFLLEFANHSASGFSFSHLFASACSHIEFYFAFLYVSV